MAGNPNMPSATAVAVWVDSTGTSHLRVYSTDGYHVTERCWDGNGWTAGTFAQAGTHVSAVAYQQAAGISIRVYCTIDDVTTEWGCDAGTNNWYQGSYTPV